MSPFMIHYCWFMIFSLISLFFLILSTYISLFFITFSISFDLFSSWFMELTFSISFDLFSSWFSFTVTLISSIIMIYSYFYMSPYSKVNYFIWLTVFFVLSMLITINVTNFFFLMLGWDGLGLVSFLLIVYYQNHSSIYSGLFTVLMNRVGDCFFIVSISMMLMFYPNLMDSVWLADYLLALFMLITFMTKSAIYPFSPWLPLAMAAPTPISALVHSSTLVTAGLYLLMRFSFLFYSSPSLMKLLLVLSVFTSFYAGLNAVFETDMKKLIALSTLSHLGFIGMSFSSGLLCLSFFHLLVHALFKSVLFMAMGDIMTNLFHAQDIRLLSSGLFYTPFSFYVMAVSLMNLLGLPSMSGYFSKDLVLETCNFTLMSFIVVFMVFLNVIFTYFYTYQLFYFSFSSVKLMPYSTTHPASYTHSLSLLFLSFLSVIFGWVWVSYVIFLTIHVAVPLVWKLTPYLLNLFVLAYLIINLKLFKVNSLNLFSYFSNMMFLSTVMMTLSSSLFLKSVFYSCKVVESGVFSWAANTKSEKMISLVAYIVYKTITLNSMYSVFIFGFMIVVMFMVLLYNM